MAATEAQASSKPSFIDMAYRQKNRLLHHFYKLQKTIQRHLHHVWVPFLYPRHCPFCHTVLPYGSILCSKCFDKLPFTGRQVCMICGKPLRRKEQEICYDCRIFPKSFQGGISLLLYNEETRQAVLDLKYHNKRMNADYFAAELFRYHQNTFAKMNFQAIIPVPVHANKKKKRGYNQAALIGEALSELLHIPCYPDLLIRRIDTLPQKEFTPQARLTNLQKAFTLNPGKESIEITRTLQRVLIIDDIYTTGATMETCTRILHHAGIREVYVCSICIGMSRD